MDTPRANPDKPHMQIVATVLTAAVQAKRDTFTTCFENDQCIMACAVLVGLERINEWDSGAWGIVWQYYCEMFDLE